MVAQGGVSSVIQVREAAQLLGVSKNTVLRRWAAGEILGRKSKGLVLLNRASVEAQLPTAEPERTPYEQICALLEQVTDVRERTNVAFVALAPVAAP